jgi:integrase
VCSVDCCGTWFLATVDSGTVPLGDAGKSPRTVSYVRAVPRAALNYAVSVDLLPRNPVAKTVVPKGAPYRPTVLTPEQVRTLLATAPDHRIYPLLKLTIHSGLRQAEALGLTWNDVVLDKGFLFVWHASGRREDKWTLTEPKSRSSHRAPDLSTSCVEALKARRTQQQEDRFQSRGAVDLLHLLHRQLKKAGVPQCRWHDLRHFAATALIGAGEDVKTVQSVLGQEDARLTLNRGLRPARAQLVQCDYGAGAPRCCCWCCDLVRKPWPSYARRALCARRSGVVRLPVCPEMMWPLRQSRPVQRSPDRCAHT